MEPNRSLLSLKVHICSPILKTSFYQLPFKELENLLSMEGFKPHVASDLYNWHYKKRISSPCEFKISKQAKNFVYNYFEFTLPQIHHVYEADDKTVKFKMELQNPATEKTIASQELQNEKNNKVNLVETVLIPFQGKYSLCVSSQVGCAMNCSFCYTGTQGLTRSLRTEEIIGQYLAAYYWLLENRSEDTKISNIVFMGQGEPLHNYDAVKSACEIFLSQHGLSIGPQKITVSTSGYLPGLLKWKNKSLGVNLALSLHSTENKVRDQLIPINKKYPLSEVLNAIDEIPLLNKQFVTYEYLLIDQFNDSSKEAHQLGELLKNKRALINLIPFNPFPGSQHQRPKDSQILEFKSILDTYKIPTMIRTTKGDSILAACGQLNSKKVPGKVLESN